MKKFDNGFLNQGTISFFENGLKDLKDKENLKFLEVGSWEGESTCWFLDNMLKGDDCKITCIDAWNDFNKEYTDHKIEEVESNFFSNIEYRKDDVEVLKGFSRDKLIAIQDRKGYYDFAYVDGGHIMKDVITDLILCFDLVKSGGIIGMDDFMLGSPQFKVGEPKDDHKRPEYAIKAFLLAFKDEIDITAVGGQVWVKKK
jgi:predicted O-methyltransferase YrrM